MVLKEAYHYQNYLSDLINEAQDYLQKRDFITKTTQVHNRKKVNAEAVDETIEVKSIYTVEFKPMDLVDFIVRAIAEKEKLSKAIATTKKSTEIDMDSSIAVNKIKQNYISVLNTMSNIKSSERETTGKDYKFDINNEQKPYLYPISETTTIDFDRNDVRNLVKKYSKETDEISAKLDLIQITAEVEFEPSFDINSTLEELVLS